MAETGSNQGVHLAHGGGDDWIAVWDSDSQLGGLLDGPDADIFYAHSHDGGATWSDPAPVNSNADYDYPFTDADSDVVTDGQGTWLVAWSSRSSFPVDSSPPWGLDWDVLYARSTNDSVSWSVPTPRNSTALSDTKSDVHVRLAADTRGHIVAVWNTLDVNWETNDDDMDVWMARSSNGGLSWSPAKPLSPVFENDAYWNWDEAPEIATDGAGTWLVAWQHTPNYFYTGDRAIMFSRSQDNGRTWTAPAFVDTDWKFDIAKNDRPSVASAGSGRWVIVWYGWDGDGTDQDIYVSTSADDGTTWSAPNAVNENAATDMNTENEVWQGVAADRGKTVVAWQTDRFDPTDIEFVVGSLCGNGIHSFDEECDDGNLVDGDGCSSTCSVEAVVICGDADGDHGVEASDALIALRTAVALESCYTCICDVDSSGVVRISDALSILRAAVGQPVTLHCQACGTQSEKPRERAPLKQ